MTSQQFITDDNGNKIAVILPMRDYKKMIDELEELEDIKLYDEAKKDSSASLPLDEAFKLIEKNRKNR